MKATLEFSIPEQTGEHQLALDGGRWMSVVHELDQWLRDIAKHSEDTKIEAQSVRSKIYEILEESRLYLD